MTSIIHRYIQSVSAHVTSSHVTSFFHGGIEKTKTSEYKIPINLGKLPRKRQTSQPLLRPSRPPHRALSVCSIFSLFSLSFFSRLLPSSPLRPSSVVYISLIISLHIHHIHIYVCISICIPHSYLQPIPSSSYPQSGSFHSRLYDSTIYYHR